MKVCASNLTAVSVFDTFIFFTKKGPLLCWKSRLTKTSCGAHYQL